MKVEILSRKLITPSSPTPAHLQNFKISSFDQLSPSNYVPCIFYYPASKDERGTLNNVERSEQLQKSLSETLTLFYPLAGRYIKDSLFVDCNDKGVEYCEVRLSGCLSQLLRDGGLETGLQDALAPNPFVQSDNNPLVKVQFNMFECGGVVIGVCVSHKVADTCTIFTFMKSWSVACRMGIDKVHCPSFQLASFCPPRDVPAIKPLAPRREGDKRLVMKKFVFDGAAISKLKVIAAGSRLLKHKPTRVEVVIGLMWKTLVQVSLVRHGCLRPSIVPLSINMRARTTLPIPENSCGNFAGMTIAQFLPDDDSNVQLYEFVSRVQVAIRGRIADYAKVSNGDDLFFMKTNPLKEMNEALVKSEIDVYNFTSWCGFPMYEADFGWGKPAWVGMVYVRAENFCLLMETKDGDDGIEVWVGLEENNMLLFEQDSDITAFARQQLQHPSTMSGSLV